MSKAIIIRLSCYCCADIEYPVRIAKPTRLRPTSFQNQCEKCGSFNTYRVSIKGDAVRIDTVFVSATERGIKRYEKNNGVPYPHS